jgi:hypothetical protein
MTYEEKMVRYVASKLIQRKFLMQKGYFPPENVLARLINQVCKQLKDEYRDLKFVRNQSEDGLITPIVKSAVDKLKIL